MFDRNMVCATIDCYNVTNESHLIMFLGFKKGFDNLNCKVAFYCSKYYNFSHGFI